MTKPNPFPDYPVTRLQDEAVEVQQSTIKTDAIIRSRKLVNQYVEQWNIKKSDPSRKIEPLIVGVKGDYGTGKTHLLLDAAAQVQQGLFLTYRDTTILRISCLETDPVKWFQQAIGPELKRPFLQSLIVSLYSRAGQRVASEAKLTEAIAVKLRIDPKSIYGLIRENLLSATAVDREFKMLLNDVCQNVSEEVQKVLAGLAWAENADTSTRWLAGETLRDEDLDKIHVSKNIINENDASGVLIALAEIHSYLDYPFAIMIDELEHLTHYDIVRKSKQNITWLKRLLEGLANNQILILISGHWSAWEAQSDILDRFSQLRPIELVKLTGDDVLKIVQTRVKDLSSDMFGKLQAEAIAEFGNGNMRRILSICQMLYRESDGFSRPLHRERILALTEEMGQRISIEDAKLSVIEILAQQKLIVHRDAAIAKGMQFDLIGYSAEQPKVLVNFKHSITQQDQLGDARRFLEQIREVSKLLPNIIGCFISDGNIDDELLSTVKLDKGITILWFDLNQRDAISRIASDLKAALRMDRKADSDIIEKEVKELSSRVTTRDEHVDKQLDFLERKLSNEFKQLYNRLDEFRNETESKRDAEIIAPSKEEVDVKLHAMYSDLTRQPSFSTKLRAGGIHMQRSILLIFSGLIIILYVNTVGSSIFYNSSAPLYRYAIPIYLTSAFLLVAYGIWNVWRSLSRIETFFDYSARTLREIYIRSENSQDLVKADNIIRSSLEEFGPMRGKYEAEKRLSKAFPDLFGYLGESEATLK